MDVVGRFTRAATDLGERVQQVRAGQWHDPTPCAGWDVRALLNHLVGELRWAVPLFDGRTIAEVGDQFDGDVLGDDPIEACQSAADAAVAAVHAPGATDRTVHLSFGATPGAEYAEQLAADLLVHSWDLARAVGADEQLDGELVDACASWFATNEPLYRGAGVIGPRPAAPPGGAQSALLAAFGRDADPHDTLSVIRRFNEAFGRHDVDAVMALMTDDCIFEDTSPPRGGRHEGQTAVAAMWAALFASSPSAAFTTEEGVIAGDRATYRWRYDFDGGSVRGVDVFRVRGGKVAEKLSYVKG